MIRNILANDNAEDYYSESRSDCDLLEDDADDPIGGRVSIHYGEDELDDDDEDDDSELDLDYNFQSTPLRNSTKELIKRKS